MSGLAEDLATLGFRRVSARRGEEWVLHASPHLIFSVLGQDDGSILFTWELAIGELMDSYGLQIGTNEALNLFAFPQRDTRGPATTEFVVDEMERVRSLLASVDLSGGRR